MPWDQENPIKAIPTGGYVPREVGSQVGRDLAAGSVRSQHSYGLNREHDHEPHASSETQEYLKYPASTLLKSSNDLGWSTLTAELRSHSRLRRLSNGGGRHPTTNVPGDPAADRGTAAAATTSASMRRSTVMHSRATDGMSASECRPARSGSQTPLGRRECRDPSDRFASGAVI